MTNSRLRFRKARQVAAKQLGKAVTAHLAEFGLTDADFRVKLLPIDEEDRQRYGRERVQFTVRTTHEMAYGPLERVASGGELSRISLALQVVTSAVDPVPISIYDEVDVGIGGRVAEIVGSKLAPWARIGRYCASLICHKLPCRAKGT
ncbi:MAG: hypothetical protein CM1200mP41_39390 [Gammaproteobacteria bacterium]|nr:MAG: hypothetical protein CM1200mP41_39390 [Gammaproteobacteria bacterium]